tara:strand:+ start:281 stop:466 length:186 start_codon:yes stop_codon:yes gene_type:complete
MKYTNIKRILKKQIEVGLKTLWTYNETDNEFTCIYENYSNELKIYTNQQLLNKLNAYTTKK